MLISMKLIKETIPNNYSASQLAEKLTSLGIEVEGIRKIKHNFKHITTGKIENIELIHDTKLFKSIINTGKEKLQIITAATNLKTGNIIPVALPGSKIANGTAVGKKNFKGVDSHGMLCSVSELGIENDLVSNEEKEGIFLLPTDTPIGVPFENVLPVDDELFEVSLLPDRADAFYLAGIARWVEIIMARDENRPANFSKIGQLPDIQAFGKNDVEIEISSKDMCPFYSGRIIRNIYVKKSSLNLRQKLFLLKIRPINNIVDVTNYIMKFYGQPLHAFDFDRLNGKIIVRTAKVGEKLTTLDGVERKLNNHNLLISDDSGPIAIAGVMGGEETAVTETTKNIFLESAYFSGQAIAKSSRSLGLITDASTLYEKGIDYKFQSSASKLAANLMKAEANGSPSEERTVSYILKKQQVKVRYDRINSILGEEVSPSDVKKYFDFEGFKYVDQGDKLLVNAPSFRQDINIEEDLIEEVVRMKGYNEFKEKMLEGKIKSGSRTEFEDFLLRLKDKLVALGLVEVNTVSLVGIPLLQSVKFSDAEELVELVNPLSEEMKYLRPTLLATVYEVLERNINVGVEDIAIFEIGKIFHKTNKYFEKTQLGIMLHGKRVEENGLKVSLKYDFFYLKGLVEEIFEGLNIAVNFSQKEYPALHPFQVEEIIADGKEIGCFGRLNKDLEKNSYYASIGVDELYKLYVKKIKFIPYSIYPPVKRDIAIVLNGEVPEQSVREAIFGLRIRELKSATLFDVYKGAPLPNQKKSLAYSLEFSSFDKTLTGEEVDKFINEIELSIKEKVQGELRKK